MEMLNTGFWDNRKIRHVLPRDFWKILVHDIKELEALPICNSSYCSEIPDVSFKIGRAILQSTAQLAVRVTKPNARLHREESK